MNTDHMNSSDQSCSSLKPYIFLGTSGKKDRILTSKQFINQKERCSILDNKQHIIAPASAAQGFQLNKYSSMKRCPLGKDMSEKCCYSNLNPSFLGGGET